MRIVHLMALSLALGLACHAEFRAGAIALDVSPKEFPVLVNGGMISRSANGVTDPIYA